MKAAAKMILIACPRCDGKGEIRCYQHVVGGVCFQCSGAGKVSAKVIERNAKACEKRAAKSAEKRAADVASADAHGRKIFASLSDEGKLAVSWWLALEGMRHFGPVARMQKRNIEIIISNWARAGRPVHEVVT